MDVQTYLLESKKLVDECLDRLLPSEKEKPTTIHKAMRYSVFAGGKRLRPILVLAAGQTLEGDRDLLLQLGASIEMMHTYSLIHDDLPALDNDNLRRGFPTCHRAFGEAIAILAGDSLMTRCYQVLAELPKASDATKIGLIREVAAATGTVNGMIGGQVVDLESEGKPVSAQVLEYIHHSKTGALLTSCVRCGAMAAGATHSQLEAITHFGNKIGLAFQIVDDVLDITSSSAELGKTAGKDSKVGKATYPALYGIEASKQKAHELVESALNDLDVLSRHGDRLRAIARYIVARTA